MRHMFSENQIKNLIGVPTPTADDSGKVVSVDENGKFALTEASSESKIYTHVLTFYINNLDGYSGNVYLTFASSSNTALTKDTFTANIAKFENFQINGSAVQSGTPNILLMFTNITKSGTTYRFNGRLITGDYATTFMFFDISNFKVTLTSDNVVELQKIILNVLYFQSQKAQCFLVFCCVT